MSFFGEIYADPDLPHRARTVYMYLRDRAGGGSCWPGIRTIARDLHLSPRTVQRAMNDLERAGYRDTTAQLEGPTLAEGKHRKEIKTMQELR